MHTFWNISRSLFLLIFFISGVASIQLGKADDDLEVGRKSKELVDEMKKKERELREETKRKIERERKDALRDLGKLLERYRSQNKKAEAESIEKEIDSLKKKMRLPAGDRHRDHEHRPPRRDREDEELIEEKANRYFEYRTNYIFNEKGLISGKLSFLPNQKVKIIYSHKGKEVSNYLDWKDMGDHVQINAGSLLGTIIISEYPSTNLKSLLIRWGGELKNKLTDGHAE